MSDDAQIGDLVVYNNEEGIVCCLDPFVMNTTSFHSYVAIQGDFVMLERAVDPHASLKSELRERIRRYLEFQHNALPTGDESP